jgi:hypothetical protein
MLVQFSCFSFMSVPDRNPRIYLFFLYIPSSTWESNRDSFMNTKLIMVLYAIMVTAVAVLVVVVDASTIYGDLKVYKRYFLY